MCLLTFYPGNILPNLDALAIGARANDDGHGFAIVDGNRIITHKGMVAETVIAEFEKVRAQFPKGPALFHSRISTSGLVDTSYVHPFVVDGDSRTVLAHNGVLPITPPKGDPRSDTRILANTLAKRFGSLRNQATRAAIVKWMGTGNKLVILSVNPRFRGNAFILNEDKGHWSEDGMWYSNYSYVAYERDIFDYSRYSAGNGYSFTGWPKTIGRAPAITRALWDLEMSCVRCDSNMSEDELQLGYCETCDTCQDCREHMAACFCYYSPRAKAKSKAK